MENIINAISIVKFRMHKGFNQLNAKQENWVRSIMNGISKSDFEKYLSRDKFLELMDSDVSNISGSDASKMWKDPSYMNHVFADCAINLVIWKKLHKENTNKACNLGIFYLEMMDTTSLRAIDVMKKYNEFR